MHNRTIKINIYSGEFNCRVFGNGENSVIAFHGFGQDGGAFSPMANSFSKFTVYAFDLPFHGETEIDENSPFISGENLIELVHELVVQRKLANFSLLAFSIGSKCVFPIIETFGSQIEKVWLLAPDGISESFWYQFATANRFTRHIFRALVNRSNIISGLTSVVSKSKIVNAEKAALVQRSIASPERSKQVYNTWIYFRKLKFVVGDIDNVLKRNDIKANIFLGDRDYVIPKIKVEKKCRGFHSLEIISFPCTHNQLIGSFLKWLEGEYK